MSFAQQQFANDRLINNLSQRFWELQHTVRVLESTVLKLNKQNISSKSTFDWDTWWNSLSATKQEEITSKFQGPSGKIGPKGSAGPAGLVGQVGPRGVAGVAGVAGVVGLVGDTGPMGIPGSVGETGPQGLMGPVGPAGPPGATTSVVDGSINEVPIEESTVSVTDEVSSPDVPVVEDVVVDVPVVEAVLAEPISVPKKRGRPRRKPKFVASSI